MLTHALGRCFRTSDVLRPDDVGMEMAISACLHMSRNSSKRRVRNGFRMWGWGIAFGQVRQRACASNDHASAGNKNTCSSRTKKPLQKLLYSLKLVSQIAITG